MPAVVLQVAHLAQSCCYITGVTAVAAQRYSRSVLTSLLKMARRGASPPSRASTGGRKTAAAWCPRAGGRAWSLRRFASQSFSSTP